jgi:hypothetical protein
MFWQCFACYLRPLTPHDLYRRLGRLCGYSYTILVDWFMKCTASLTLHRYGYSSGITVDGSLVRALFEDGASA